MALVKVDIKFYNLGHIILNIKFDYSLILNFIVTSYVSQFQ